jgi:5-methylcytosine-specific restriction endonuclease McrA
MNSVIPRADRPKWSAFLRRFLKSENEAAHLGAVIGMSRTAGKSWWHGKAAALPKRYPQIAKILGVAESEVFQGAGLNYPGLEAYQTAVASFRRAHARQQWAENPIPRAKPFDQLTPRGKMGRHLKELPPEIRAEAMRLRRNHAGCDRRARAKGSPGGFLRGDLYQLFKSWNHCCAYCGTPRSRHTRITIDHVRPMAHGGTNFITNIAPACYSCNSSKQNCDLVEWATRKGLILSERILAVYRMQYDMPVAGA